MKTSRTRGRNGDVTHWWQALMAVPQEKKSLAYRRLKRVWFDHTRFKGGSLEKTKASEYEVKRQHEFLIPNHETHLTVSLWENFTLFPAGIWLPRLLEISSMETKMDSIANCRWSYEWYGYRPRDENSKNHGQGMCDVVVSYETGGGEKGVLVVEAKNLKKGLGGKELQLDYYLGIQEIASYGENAKLIYLIDDSVREKSAQALGDLPSNVGLVTWQEFAGLQISLAQTINAPSAVKCFVAGAIQFQFAQHDIRPTILSSAYLESEPSILEMDSLPKEEKQKMSDHSETLWRE